MKFQDIQKILDSMPSPVEKLEMVMDFGKKLEPVPDNATCTDIIGCSSFVQICRLGDRFYGRADSAIVRGIVAIILSMIDGKKPDEFRQMDLLKMFQDLNLNLGASRLNGVNSMVRFFHNL